MKTKSISAVLFCTLLLSARLHADPVTLEDPFNLLRQSEILGDGFGYRKWASDQGIVLTAQSTSDLFGNTTGGAGTGTTYSGLLNLGLAIDLQKAVGWEGASFKCTWLWLYGTDVSSKYVGNALTVSGVAGNPAFRCYELWFQQNFLNDAISLRGGMLGVDTEFMVSDTANLFINSTFGPPALFTLNMPNGGPTYPMATPGVRLAVQPTSWLTIRSVIAQANPFSQQQNARGFNWNLGPNGGLLSLSEVAASWNQSSSATALPGTAKAGFWVQTGMDQETSQEPSGDDVFNFGSPEARAYGSGFYGIIDQQLYNVSEEVISTQGGGSGKNPLPVEENPQPVSSSSTFTGKGLSSFARIGFSPEPGSQVGFYSDAGLVYTGLIPTRDADKLGVAFGYAQMGSQYASLGSSSGVPGVGYEAVAELSYAMQFSPAISIQPDLQYILHPGGTQQYGNALAVGVRAVVNF